MTDFGIDAGLNYFIQLESELHSNKETQSEA